MKPDFKLPHVDQFSFGFQYELPGHSKIEASYVGSRSNDLQSNANINTYDLAFRKQCNLMEGGNPLFCDQLLPNPYPGTGAVCRHVSLHQRDDFPSHAGESLSGVRRPHPANAQRRQGLVQLPPGHL